MASRWEVWSGGDPAILSTYTDALAGRFGTLLGGMAGADRLAVVDVLDQIDRAPGGALGAITAPPVSAVLLGRRPMPPSLHDLETELLVGAESTLTDFPEIVGDPAWLRGLAPGEAVPHVIEAAQLQPGWDVLSHHAPDVADAARLLTRTIAFRRTGDAREI